MLGFWLEKLTDDRQAGFAIGSPMRLLSVREKRPCWAALDRCRRLCISNGTYFEWRIPLRPVPTRAIVTSPMRDDYPGGIIIAPVLPDFKGQGQWEDNRTPPDEAVFSFLRTRARICRAVGLSEVG
jgi:hypothetical protein